MIYQTGSGDAGMTTAERRLLTAAILVTAYAVADIVFVNWAGSVRLEVPTWFGAFTLGSGPVACVAAVVLWGLWVKRRPLWRP